jgi:hypothetical protein
MAAWMGSPAQANKGEVGINYWHQSPSPEGLNTQAPYVLVNPQNSSWGSFHVATYRSRPAHADQLHLDLWWRGYNLAQDPGTYLYNSAPPWENALTSACVHNTVVVDESEFMQRVGRFLYLDWAQGKLISYQSAKDNISASLTAEHNGYRKIGVTHTREVTIRAKDQWEIIDHVLGVQDHPHSVRLHWLLPDWEYEVLGPTQEIGMHIYIVRIRSPQGWVSLKIGVSNPQEELQPQTISFQLVRAGTLLFGSGEAPTIAGWTSPTYGDKIPALACICEVNQILPVELSSEWTLPSES